MPASTCFLSVLLICVGLSTSAWGDDSHAFFALEGETATKPVDEDLQKRLNAIELQLATMRTELAASGGPVKPSATDQLPGTGNASEDQQSETKNAVLTQEKTKERSGQDKSDPQTKEGDKPASVAYPSVKINGFLQADTLYFTQDELNRAQLGDIQDGAGFRRTRISASGAVAENVQYFVQMDYGFFGRPTFTDVWGEVTQVPHLGNIRFGQWKQPYSLEIATTVRYQTFLERSLLFLPFGAFRHLGAGFYNNSHDELWTWALSGFRTGNDQFGNDIGDNGGWGTSGRCTHLLWYDDYQDGCKTLDYLHLGNYFWYGDPGNDRTQYRTPPEAFLGAFGVPAGTIPGTSGVQIPSIANGTPPFVDTGLIPTNNFTHVGTELLWVRGPSSWQAEAQFATVSQTDNVNLHFWGYYSQLSYFLTGESRPYLKKLGQLDRVVPLRPFFSKGGSLSGPGAWELASRVSHINLNSNNIQGGDLTDWTLGLNWYLNGFTKFQFNFVHPFLDRNFRGINGRTHANAYGLRFQVDF